GSHTPDESFLCYQPDQVCAFICRGAAPLPSEGECNPHPTAPWAREGAVEWVPYSTGQCRTTCIPYVE
uniref:Metallocarboxypeptidase inhibitor n=1 Tax=Hirudo medicinalis TaxID=6421 RepID=UPI00006912B3|nr:Chain C, Metallocarboxypeptidase inhibitor [Hirudo medicinalis]2ABZ_D Chain D, Metallocarboxypeptidase inhibitor [Hirudo medicinalis]2ABZ_E Chain E, Metallocarboxypeptidase inhibitor [Hirudo medicinalis]2ABZ_F Chain F, Metallocarboxypeptidase inhibitor [Hirudo medicinalis]